MTIIKKAWLEGRRISHATTKKEVAHPFNLLKIKTDIKAGNICIEQCEARAPGEQYAANCVSACELTGLA